MLSQQGFKVPGQIGARGQELQIVLLLRVCDGAAAQKSCANVCTDAGLTADQGGVDLQARLAAGGAEQFMHPRHLFRLPDVELIQYAAGALLFQNVPLHTAAGKKFPGQLHCVGLLGLEHQPPFIKIFGKAGKAIRCRTHAAVLLQAALCDLLPCTGCKAHSGSSILVSAWHRGAGHPARSRGMCSTPRSCAQK